MSKLLVDDALWELVEPLLPAPKPRRFRYPGRKPLENRAALTGILFILKTGLPWNDLPREMGCGSGAACWVRLHEWHKPGVRAALHGALLARLRYADKIDWSRAAVDATTLRALRGGDKTGKTPTDRGSMGTRDHLLTGGGGIPLAAHATAANRHEATQLKTLIEEVPPVAGRPGHPKRKPEALLGDRAFDSQALREWLWAGASFLFWPNAASLTAVAWGCAAMWWSAPSPGSRVFAACACATNALPSCTKPS